MAAGSTAPPSAYGWRIARVHGIPVYLGRSWPIVAAVIVLTFGPQVHSPTTDADGGTFGYAVAVAYALLLLFSVLTHEGAHAVVARRFGYRVDRVVADLWGGHTVYDSASSRPGDSAAIAVAGPLANLGLAGLSLVLGRAVDGGVVTLLLGALTLTNVFVGIFNLLPGLPLDGGFLVDALVWKVTGDRNQGLIVAGWLGRALTVAVVLWLVGRPLVEGQSPSLYTIVWCGLIGAFLWAGATNAIRTGRSRRVIQRMPLAQVLRPVVTVATADSVEQVLSRLGGEVERMPGRDAPPVVAVEPGGQPVGLVDLATLLSIEPSRRTHVPVAAVVVRQPADWVVVADPGEDVSGVISAIVARQSAGEVDALRLVLVVSRAGRVVGTVSVGDLDTAFG